MSGTFAFIEKEKGPNDTIQAVKIYKKSHGSLVYNHYKREIEAFKKLNISNVESAMSKHVVHLISFRETPLSFQLLFPFYDETLATVSGQISKNSKRKFAYDFIQQISKGLSYLHEKDIIHCDLSPSNILMDAKGCMFISDFGCSQSKDTSLDKHEEIGTRWYKAPEHLFGYKIYASTSDVWSLGAIFVELMLGEPLFASEGDLEQIGIVVRALGNPSDIVQEEISIYPDYNKLYFFTSDVSDYEDSDSEYERPVFKTLVEILKEGCVSDKDQVLISSILTWSRKDRATVNKILLEAFE